MTLLLTSCDGATKPEIFAPTFAAAVTGAIIDDFDVTLPMPPDTDLSLGGLTVLRMAAPLHVQIVAFRPRDSANDLLLVSIPDVRSTVDFEGEGIYFRHGLPPRRFLLATTVRVTRLTGTRLTGVFTAVGIEASPVAGAVPDTVQVTGGRFDLPLDEPFP